MVFAVTVVASVMAARPGDRALWPLGVVLIAVAVAPLAVRRRHPVVLLVVATAVLPVYYPMGFPDGPLAVVFLVALFTASVECRLSVSLWSVILINAGFLAVGSLRDGGLASDDPDAVVSAGSVAGLSITLLLTIAAGQYVRNRRAKLAAAERRAVEAERDREREAARRATAERLRIARELHDVLAHQISLINVQAGAALHRRDDPDRAYEALEAIKGASKQTLRELRGVLGVLRQVDQDPGGDGSPVEPAPSLERLDGLLERTSAAGLRVRREPPGGDEAGAGAAGGGLAAPVALAGYRIVQEALTNVVRHSGAQEVRVAVRYAGGMVIVEVGDDGDGPADPGALERGNGLRGMRERAAAVGGAVTAGAGPGGGFRVVARLPVDGAPPPEDVQLGEGVLPGGGAPPDANGKAPAGAGGDARRAPREDPMEEDA